MKVPVYRYVYVQCIHSGNREEPPRFRHGFVHATDDDAAYTAGHRLDRTGQLSDVGPSGTEYRFNDYVVPVDVIGETSSRGAEKQSSSWLRRVRRLIDDWTRARPTLPAHISTAQGTPSRDAETGAFVTSPF